MKEEIRHCIDVLKKGGVIIYPADTVWGIGCDATNARAVDRLNSIKGREPGKSLIILLDTEDKIPDYVKEVPGIAYDLIGQVTTPLTIVFPGGINLAPNVLAPDGSIAVRIVREGFPFELLREHRKPLVSSSANFSGEPTAFSFGKINTRLFDMVDYVVNYGRNTLRQTKTSSIIRIGPGGEIELIRQ